jgi:DNA (cytosine-5)-methyltransferase 1|tara:strand:- start:47 stop:1204 length:1158 start_codon:yes stop_codon:yes gene_type:complete
VSLNDKEKIKVLSLFAGIGGIDLGLESTGRFETVQFVEYERFCQHILRRHWPDVPIWGDVKTFDPDSCGDIDLICGGYPCQPFSVAGKQKGAEDDRHLWPRMFEIIKHKRPTWVLCENVSGHVNLGLDQVLFDLESEGYSWQTIVLGAVAVDAPHRRQRLFIVANTNNTGDRTSQRRTDQNRQTHDEGQEEQPQFKSGGHSTDVANTDNKGLRTRIGGANAYNEEDGRARKDNRGRSTRNAERNNITTSKNENLDVPNTNVEGLEGQRIDKEISGKKTSRKFDEHSSEGDVSDTISERGCSGQTGNQDAEDVGEQPRGTEHGERSIERRLGGMVDGVPTWMDEPDISRVTTHQVGRTQRLKALGNAVVPQVVAQIARAIIIEQDR